MPNNVMDVIKCITGELKEIASTHSVVGEAITVGNKTVVPVIKVSVGFGAGGAEGEKKQSGGGFGAGGGGGAIVEPAAFIIMDDERIALLPAKPGKIDSIIEAIPAALSRIIDIKDKFGTKKSGDDGGGETEPEAAK